MACMAAARDDHDVCDACVKEGLEGVVDHRLVVDREQVLVGYFCEGVEAGASAACEDNTFHVFYHQVNIFFDRMVLKYLNDVVGDFEG